MGERNKKSEVIEGEVSESPKPRKTRALTKHQEVSVVAGLSLDTKQLKNALEAQTEQRKLISAFIKDHLIKDVDYIRIHVVRKENCRAEMDSPGSCKNDRHFSKSILAKPGQEKIFSLFQLTSELVRDNETIEMLEGIKNLVAYKCLVKKGDNIVAEGRGAAVVGDNRRDVNATIKIAEKRARMDACLSLGFSEYFAQDLDDPEYQVQKKAAEEEAAAKANDGTGLTPRPAKAKMDDQERTMLARYMLKMGFSNSDEQLELLRINGIDDPKTMTSGMARTMIVKLKNSAFAAPPPKTDTVLDPDEVEDEDPAKTLDDAERRLDEEKKAELEKEPELVVDDEFKAEVESRAQTLGLNARGQMWLMQKIAGKPFAKWQNLADKEWRRAYDVVMGILEGNIKVDDRYFAGFVENVDMDSPKKPEAKEKATKA